MLGLSAKATLVISTTFGPLGSSEGSGGRSSGDAWCRKRIRCRGYRSCLRFRRERDWRNDQTRSEVRSCRRGLGELISGKCRDDWLRRERFKDRRGGLRGEFPLRFGCVAAHEVNRIATGSLGSERRRARKRNVLITLDWLALGVGFRRLLARLTHATQGRLDALLEILPLGISELVLSLFRLAEVGRAHAGILRNLR